MKVERVKGLGTGVRGLKTNAQLCEFRGARVIDVWELGPHCRVLRVVVLRA